ncbi:hypothetical protein SAMN04487886_11071 [Clostridium sp. DSM 8431]|uniref:hypothetical protein n=1 Tax=Clostridium sp. DSM 8431 TaxID=1761781 RepID=UPI0008EDC10C|nr:hypothetical protein [Clostridium sp. DSM 8431]SFU69720.1 hypothetical protein SAMN04487886_11071 [Clostridium sp. DSM 8431]
MNNLIPISHLIFNENVSIKFNNILEGLDNFNNFEIKGTELNGGENTIIDFLTEIFELNDNECFIDLYLNNLDGPGKNNLLNMCCPDDKDMIIKHINLNHNEPYYKVKDKSLIPFLARLNTREVFFVTFYFTKIPLTIWGNYNMTFPCFSDKENNIDFYKNIAKSYNLL